MGNSNRGPSNSTAESPKENIEILNLIQPITRANRPATQKKQTNTPGHTVIDWLIVRAGVRRVLGLDYGTEIALARKLAALAERRPS